MVINDDSWSFSCFPSCSSYEAPRLQSAFQSDPPRASLHDVGRWAWQTSGSTAAATREDAMVPGAAHIAMGQEIRLQADHVTSRCQKVKFGGLTIGQPRGVTISLFQDELCQMIAGPCVKVLFPLLQQLIVTNI